MGYNAFNRRFEGTCLPPSPGSKQEISLEADGKHSSRLAGNRKEMEEWDWVHLLRKEVLQYTY
jgi:hypothetical protein